MSNIINMSDEMEEWRRHEFEKDILAYKLLKEMEPLASSYMEMQGIIDRMQHQLAHAMQTDRVSLLDYPITRYNQKIVPSGEETPDGTKAR